MNQKTTTNGHQRINVLGAGFVIFLLLFQIWSRYMPSPWAVFVADDWDNLARSSFYSTHWEALTAGLQDPNRPLSMAAVETIFRIFGTRAWCWTLVSLVGNSLLLVCFLGMVWGLTGRKTAVLLSGILYALWPNLTETFHWSTQVLNEVSCALLFYALSGWMWVDYVRQGTVWRLFLSAGAYFIALFSYEAGILLPACYAVLLPWTRAPARSAARISLFIIIAIAYAAWRSTNAFGMNELWRYPPHMEAGMSIRDMAMNVRDLAQWWAGDRMVGSVLNGLESFSTLAPWTRRILVAGNVMVVGWLGWILCRSQQDEGQDSPPFSLAVQWWFVLGWIGVTMVIPVASYVAPRLIVLPALGVSVLLALVLTRLPIKAWGGMMAVFAVLALASNQGTTESYRQAGDLNMRLYRHVVSTVDQWRDLPAIVFDTKAIRHRLTRGLSNPASSELYAWAGYRNAPLIWGFVMGGMVKLGLNDPRPAHYILHDIECGVRSDGDYFIWHERFNPDRLHRTPKNRVFVIDLGEILWSPDEHSH